MFFPCVHRSQEYMPRLNLRKGRREAPINYVRAEALTHKAGGGRCQMGGV